MNDLLKILSKSLKPFGYHIARHSAPALLKIKNIEAGQDGEQSILFPRHYFDGCVFDPPSALDLNHLKIYLRSCMRDHRNVNKKMRVSGDSENDTLLACIASLVAAVNYLDQQNPALSIEVICLDDRSDAGNLARIDHILSGLNCPWHIKQTAISGQGKSLHEQFSLARQEKGLCYFIEDDYLHEVQGIDRLYQFYLKIINDFNAHCVLYTQESDNIYHEAYPSYLLKGQDCRWRTVRHATHSFFIHSHYVDHFWKYFENTKYVGVKSKRRAGSERNTTNKLFLHMPGFVPLTPAAVHLQFQETLPPFYDWQVLYKLYQQ